MKKNIFYFIIFLLLVGILFFVFSLLLNKKDYNYEKIIGNSYIANDNSYLILNKDNTFIWYKDKENKEEYYKGTYNLYRGENAIKYISSQLSIYDISEEEQRIIINNNEMNDAIDHYYLLIIKNEKLIINEKEESLSKETKYYGFATEDYKELDFYNLDSNNYAIFYLE